MPDYSDAEVIKRMGGGPDKKRKATYDQWLIQAKAGDKEALRRLYLQADPDGPGGGGAGTRDSRNYLRLILRDQGPLLQSAGYDPTPIQGYMEQGDAQFSVGKLAGGLLKYGAPIAGALIPGVGMIGAAAIGGLGNAGGQLIESGKVNLKQAVGAGAGSAIANKALGNGLGGGSTNWGFGSTPAGIAPGGPTPGDGGTGSSGIPTGAPGSKPGLLDRFSQVGDAFQKYGPLALGAAGAIQHAGEDNKAGDLRDQGVRMATDDWNQRAPLRDAARARLMAPRAPRRDLSTVFEDKTDPYRRPQAVPVGAP